MAINKPVISAGPTATRVGLRISCVPITNTDPTSGAIRRYLENGIIKTDAQTPQREGQMLAYSDGAAITIYVVVDISGTLTWKMVGGVMGAYNTKTGKPWRSY